MTQQAAGQNTSPNNLFYCRGILPHTEIALPQSRYNVYYVDKSPIHNHSADVSRIQS